jgi:dTMP kinase
LVLDVPVEVALGRLPKKQADRFESENRSYFERVRAGYLERAAAEPGRVRIVDSRRPIEQVKEEVEELVSTIC